MSFDASGALVSTGELSGLKLLASGKVRDLYEVSDSTLLVVSTDRISAFDVIMTNGIAGKGKVLSQLTVFWLKLLEAEGIKHHLITADVNEMPESCRQHAALLQGRSMLVKRLAMLPVEAIVRGYITGSGWVDYQATGSVCGHVLPEKLQLCAKLPTTLFTPSTKADLGDHDENITVDQCDKLLGEESSLAVQSLAKQVYEFASSYAASRGILVADTKMEFGTLPGASASDLIVGDEHGRASRDKLTALRKCIAESRLLLSQEGYAVGRDQDSFDKQYVRNYLKSINFDKKTPIELPAEVTVPPARIFFTSWSNAA
ncbi:MAG: hypothetical protein SGPRY_008566 [Prymnesium sp.]